MRARDARGHREGARRLSTYSVAEAADGATDLKVQAVVYQADIAVDKQGTTAAAATGVVVGRKVSVEVGSSLTVDRPFLFFIVHQPTGALLSAGRVVDPTATN
jgi:serpin B